MQNFYVITGGPCTGKSTLIDELRRQGYRCVEEGAREIIEEQLLLKGDAFPWQNLAHFQELMHEHVKNSYKKMKEDNHIKDIVFFDRGILDLVAYERLTATKNSKELLKSVQSMTYNKKVFICPPWPAIFHMDSVRRESFEQALIIHQQLVKVYAEYGNELIEIPQTSPLERVQFIINEINEI